MFDENLICMFVCCWCRVQYFFLKHTIKSNYLNSTIPLFMLFSTQTPGDVILIYLCSQTLRNIRRKQNAPLGKH